MQCKPNYTLKTNIQITYTNSTHRDFALFSLIAQKKKHKKYFIQCHCQNYFEKTCLWFVVFSFLQIHSGYAVHGQLHQETLRHFFLFLVIRRCEEGGDTEGSTRELLALYDFR